MAGRRVMEVKAREALRRHDQPRAFIQPSEPTQEAARELPVSMTYEPDFTEMPAGRPEGVVARRSGNPNMPLLHLPVLERAGRRFEAR